MNGISVAAQRGNVNATIFKFLFPRFRFCSIGKEFINRTVPGTGIAAGANLHCFQTEGTHAIEHFVEREFFVDGIEDADRNSS